MTSIRNLVAIVSFFVFTTIILVGCAIDKTLSKEVTFGDWRMDYLQTCGNTANHKPCIILVQAYAGHKASVKRTYYWLYQQSETVHKGEDNARGRKNHLFYSIVYSDSNNIHFAKEDSLLLNNQNYKYGNSISLTPLDSFVFKKVIELTASEKIKDFSYLLKAKGFRQIIKVKNK